MTCTNCGTEIAEKALICYRCGQATTEPRIKPPAPGQPRRSGVASAIALVVLAIAGTLMGQAAQGDVPHYVGYALAVLAAVALVLRYLVRRR
jgi:hypothetical protein